MPRKEPGLSLIKAILNIEDFFRDEMENDTCMYTKM